MNHKLSETILPNVDASTRVIEGIKQLEATISYLDALIIRLNDEIGKDKAKINGLNLCLEYSLTALKGYQNSPEKHTSSVWKPISKAIFHIERERQGNQTTATND